MVAKRETYYATVRVVVITDVPLRAKTMEEAITEAKELDEKDVVSLNTDFNDGSIKVVSVGVSGAWNVD